MDQRADSIVAIASGTARAGVGVVRVSGPLALAIARAMLGREPLPRRALRARFVDAAGSFVDDGIALYFAAPRSFTGEDVLELHGHGNPLLLAQLVNVAVELGARHARPGEFSERAFLNGKMDLAQAEAVADLIAAGSAAQLRAARRSLDGVFSHQVEALLAALIRLRVWVEAAIDFPAEEIDFLADPELARMLAALLDDLAALLAQARSGQRLRDGLHCVIVGQPNAGKSSLLNALAGSERAIVTAIAGTTRDLLREVLALDGAELTLVDSAGLRDSADPVEIEGVRRARAELERADLALVVVDGSVDVQQLTLDLAALAQQLPATGERWWLVNQLDRLGPAARAAALAATSVRVGEDASVLPISAVTGEGLDALRALLRERAGGLADPGSFSARARHVAALTQVLGHSQTAAALLAEGHTPELIAEELRAAGQRLGEITGRYSADDLLGAIFGSFCIGK